MPIARRCASIPMPRAYSAIVALHLHSRGRLTETVAAFRAALKIRSRAYAKAVCNLGSALADQGRREEAVAAFGGALHLQPDYAEAGSNPLFCLNYDRRCSNAELIEAHRAWEERYGRAAPVPAA
jgi:protein O-GlcNAc transferase